MSAPDDRVAALQAAFEASQPAMAQLADHVRHHRLQMVERGYVTVVGQDFETEAPCVHYTVAGMPCVATLVRRDDIRAMVESQLVAWMDAGPPDVPERLSSVYFPVLVYGPDAMLATWTTTYRPTASPS